MQIPITRRVSTRCTNTKIVFHDRKVERNSFLSLSTDEDRSGDREGSASIVKIANAGSPIVKRHRCLGFSDPRSILVVLVRQRGPSNRKENSRNRVNVRIPRLLVSSTPSGSSSSIFPRSFCDSWFEEEQSPRECFIPESSPNHPSRRRTVAKDRVAPKLSTLLSVSVNNLCRSLFISSDFPLA